MLRKMNVLQIMLFTYPDSLRLHEIHICHCFLLRSHMNRNRQTWCLRQVQSHDLVCWIAVERRTDWNGRRLTFRGRWKMKMNLRFANGDIQSIRLVFRLTYFLFILGHTPRTPKQSDEVLRLFVTRTLFLCSLDNKIWPTIKKKSLRACFFFSSQFSFQHSNCAALVLISLWFISMRQMYQCLSLRFMCEYESIHRRKTFSKTFIRYHLFYREKGKVWSHFAYDND